MHRKQSISSTVGSVALLTLLALVLASPGTAIGQHDSNQSLPGFRSPFLLKTSPTSDQPAAKTGAELRVAPNPQSFTFNGQLEKLGIAANDTLHLRFSLWDETSTPPTPYGGYVTLSPVPVYGGFFCVELNTTNEFGPDAFNGGPRWLQIDVCSDGTCGSYTTLPLQELLPAPYAHALRMPYEQTFAIPGSCPFTVVNNAPHDFSTNQSAICGRTGVTPPSVPYLGTHAGVTGQGTGPYGMGLLGYSENAIAVVGLSDAGTGVLGQCNKPLGTGVTGIAYDSAGPTRGVHGLGGGINGTGVYGIVPSNSGVTYAVFGTCFSTNGHGGYFTSAGTGVYATSSNSSGIAMSGYASSGTGATLGVQGQSISPSGIGVKGTASSIFGVNFGVEGLSSSSEGFGVAGFATSSTGATRGVFGRSNSTLGLGVSGEASATSGATNGVLGTSTSNTGTGVRGTATATSGVCYGVAGETKSKSGRGVSGRASAGTGVNYGVAGRSDSTSGFGVSGEATAGTGTTYGVSGSSASTSGQGVRGLARAATGITYGVHGQALSTAGRGVFGEATSGSTGWGVYGVSTGNAGGVGVRGDATASTGGNIGVMGLSSSQTGWAGYFQGRGYFSGNLGVGTSAPSEKLQVLGNICATGTIGVCSDARFKKHVEPVRSAMKQVERLRGVTFDWKCDEFADHRFAEGRQVGFIAQEVEKVLPQVVSKGSDGYLSVDYGRLTPLLVEALKELKSENEALKVRLQKLEATIGRSAHSPTLDAR